MNLKTILDRMGEAGFPCRRMPLQDGSSLLITQRGGRIFGPFLNAEDEGLFWTSPALNSREAFSVFLAGGSWNIGGDRIWIAPEIQFSVADRQRFWQTLQTPPAVDPGSWTLSGGGEKVTLEQSLALQARVIARGEVSLEVRRTIRPAANPLRCLPQAGRLMEGVRYAGYEQLLQMTANGPASAECWDLLQVRPKGTVYIPMYSPHRGVDYYEPAGAMEQLLDGGVRLAATGSRRYKTGYRAACVTGRLGYATHWQGSPCLLVRNFFNSPSGSYREEPPHLPGTNGFSVHVYNDDGNSGGFAELECNLPGVAGDTGYGASMDRVSTWIFRGSAEKLQPVAAALLGPVPADLW